MASLWKHPKSQFWFACFTDSAGRRRKVSTKSTERKAAMKIAWQFEEAYRQQRTAEHVEKVIRRAHEEFTGEKSAPVTVTDFVATWNERKKSEGASPASLVVYALCTGRFHDWLGPAAKKPLTSVTRLQLENYRDWLFETVAVKTVQLHCRVLRMFFKAARETHGIESPAEFLRAPKADRGADRVKKAAFTAAELREVIAGMEGEMKTLTLLGAYTGARLADLQLLEWSNVDLEKEIICFTARKTGRLTRIPIAPPLLRTLREIPHGVDGYLLPELAKKKTNSLSKMFVLQLKALGHRREGKKVRGVRRTTGLSFHSLRHGFVSMLKEVGASAAVAMEFAGHDSEQMSQHYTTVGDQAMRTAAAALPDLSA